MTQPEAAGCVHYEVNDGIAVIMMNHAPVNALNLALRIGLIHAFERASADRQVRAVILAGAGRGFCAGGDIREFGTPAALAAPGLSLHVHPVMESMNKPVVAAIHGMSIGGGLETALVCHYRVAESDAKIALPEVRLNTLPVSGTQRLPRVLGVPATINFILSARMETAGSFAGSGLFDAVVEPGTGLAAADRLARHAADLHESGAQPLPLIRNLPVDAAGATASLSAARENLKLSANSAQWAVLDAIEAGLHAENFDAGMHVARSLYNRLMESDAVRSARDQFVMKGAGQMSE